MNQKFQNSLWMSVGCWFFFFFNIFKLTCCFAWFIIVQMSRIKPYVSHFFPPRATWIIAHFEHKRENLLNASCRKPSGIRAAAWCCSLGERNGKLAQSNFIPWHISKLTLRTHFHFMFRFYFRDLEKVFFAFGKDPCMAGSSDVLWGFVDSESVA